MTTTLATERQRTPLRLVLFTAWTLVLVAGFAVVILLGAPIQTSDQELAAAKAPATPVSEDTARRSAETIIRLEYPEFVGVTPAVEQRADFGVTRYVLVYSDPEQGAGVRISITIASGKVDVSSFN
jgi:hypothetical protein